MFTLPSVWNIVISSIVFFGMAWYVRRELTDKGMPAGFTRGLLVFLLAYMASVGSGLIVDWVEIKYFGKAPVTEMPKEISDLLKENGINLP
jgi:hypothetical protein